MIVFINRSWRSCVHFSGMKNEPKSLFRGKAAKQRRNMNRGVRRAIPLLFLTDYRFLYYTVCIIHIIHHTCEGAEDQKHQQKVKQDADGYPD